MYIGICFRGGLSSYMEEREKGSMGWDWNIKRWGIFGMKCYVIMVSVLPIFRHYRIGVCIADVGVCSLFYDVDNVLIEYYENIFIHIIGDLHTIYSAFG